MHIETLKGSCINFREWGLLPSGKRILVLEILGAMVIDVWLPNVPVAKEILYGIYGERADIQPYIVAGAPRLVLTTGEETTVVQVVKDFIDQGYQEIEFAMSPSVSAGATYLDMLVMNQTMAQEG